MEEIRKEKDDLRQIVDAIFNIDILKKGQHHKIVEARMVFTKILVERGHTIISISRYLQKNHATVIYYRRKIDSWIEFYPNINNMYSTCKKAFLDGRSPLELYKEKQVSHIIAGLRAKIDELSFENVNLKNKLNRYRRMDRIVKLLCDRVVEGDEDRIYVKINAMLNNNK